MTIIYLDTRRSQKPAPVAQAEIRATEGVWGLLSVWWYRARMRRALHRDLEDQPDSVFEDAGLSRAEVAREVAKPFWRA